MIKVTDPTLLAQLNGGASQSTGGMQKVTDPALLAQLNGQSVPEPQAPPMSALDKFNQYGSDISRHLGAEIGSAAQNTANAWGRLAPKVMQTIGQMPGGESIGLAQKLFMPKEAPQIQGDLYKGLGVNKNLADELIQGGLEFAPYGAGAARVIPSLGEKFLQKLGTNVAQQGAAGAIESMGNAPEGQEGMGALQGAGLGALAGGAGSVVSAAAKPVAGWYARSALPAALKQGQSAIKNALGAAEKGPQDYVASINKVNDTHENLLGQTRANASNLDQQFAANNKKFSAAPYEQTVRDFQQEVKSMSGPKQVAYDQAKGFLNSIERKLKPTNFDDLIDVRQNLNSYWKKYADKKNITTKDSKTSELIDRIKESLTKTIDHNTQGTEFEGAANQFKNTWEDWNKVYSNLKDYEKSPGISGALENNKVMKQSADMAKQEEPQIPSTGQMSKYIPSTKETGTEKFEHFSKLIGNESEAREAIKNYYLRNVDQSSKESSRNAVLDLYESLSPKQRDWLFNGNKGGAMMEQASRAAKEFGRPKPPSPWASIGLHGAGSAGLGTLGYFGSELAGADPRERAAATLSGIGLGLGGRGLRHLIGRPAGLGKAMDIYENGLSIPYVGGGINSYLQGNQ